jgi:hypothetical protein
MLPKLIACERFIIEACCLATPSACRVLQPSLLYGEHRSALEVPHGQANPLLDSAIRSESPGDPLRWFEHAAAQRGKRSGRWHDAVA